MSEINLHETMDAKVWTDEFFRLNPSAGMPWDLMIGWFANAIMAGSDVTRWKMEKEISIKTCSCEAYKAEIDKLQKENSWLKAWRKVARKWWKASSWAKAWKSIAKKYFMQIKSEEYTWCDDPHCIAKNEAIKIKNWWESGWKRAAKKQNELMLAHSKLLDEMRQKYIAAREVAISLAILLKIKHPEKHIDFVVDKRLRENK